MCNQIHYTVFSNLAILSVDFVPEFLTFNISFAKFPVFLSMDKHSTHNNEEFGGCLIKIYQIHVLSILHISC